jgi:hypothetical protein
MQISFILQLSLTLLYKGAEIEEAPMIFWTQWQARYWNPSKTLNLWLPASSLHVKNMHNNNYHSKWRLLISLYHGTSHVSSIKLPHFKAYIHVTAQNVVLPE